MVTVRTKMIDVEPAEYAQVVKSGDDWVIVESDVGDIVKELKAIDPRLCVKVNPKEEIYVLYMKEEKANGEIHEYLVNSFKGLDYRIVERVRKIAHSSYRYSDEIDRLDQQAKKDFDYKMDQKIEANAEKLAHAIRKDLGINKDRAFFNG